MKKIKLKIKNLIKKFKKWKLEKEIDKPMLKFYDLALTTLFFIHGLNNMTILTLLVLTVPRNVKIGIFVYLIISNIVINVILHKFGKVWFK